MANPRIKKGEQKASGKKKLPSGTVSRVLAYLRAYLPLVALSLVFSVITAILTLLVPLYVGDAIDCMVGKGRILWSPLWRILLKIGITIVVTALLQWLQNVCNNRITFFVVRDIRKDAFERIQHLPLQYLDSHSHGDLVSRVIADADQFADGLLMGLTQFFTGAVTIFGTLFFMFRIRFEIALVILLITPLSFFAARFISGHTYRFFQEQTEERGKTTGYLTERLTGSRVVKAMGCEKQVRSEFDAHNEALRKASLKAIFFSSLTNPVTRFVNSIAYAAVALAGALTALQNPAFTVGTLSSFLAYANQYTKPFNEITGVITELQGSLACAARVFALIDENPQSPEPRLANGELSVLKTPRGAVTFRDVSFSYKKNRPLIEDLNLEIRPGMQTAIVGPTGCGKTTLINLLMRFYDPDSGQILVDGQDIRDVSRQSLRASYGMVLQETWMRTGSVKENIAMGRPDASMEDIIAAAKAAHAHGFIKRLPKGYDTLIGEGGTQLGEGQKQLLSIARVMLMNPAMLILDEATSSIDTRTEMKVQSAFARLVKGRTSFIVAHRLRTIQNADLILVMKDGQIIEQGTHESLLRDGGFYAHLYHSQFDTVSG